MRGVAVATVVAKSHLSFARVLAQSFRRHHSEATFYVLLADEAEGYFDPASEPFLMLRLEDLDIPDLTRFRFHYTQQELTYAATPYLLSYLLDQGFARAAFLKQESLVLDNLEPVFELLNQYSIALTPHLLAPLPGQSGIERELNILQSGVFNVGFLGVSDKPEARAFLKWWEDRLYKHCRHNVPHGMHFEQRWLDLVPAFFDDVHVIRDPGFNVGHWNLPEREIAIGDEGVVTVDGEPCRFLRFSGYDPDLPEAVTRYNSRLDMTNVGPAAELFRRYLTLLEEASYHETKSWPYAFGHFGNGAPVTEAARRAYRKLGEDTLRFGDPLDTARDGNFFRWYHRQTDLGLGVRGAAARLWRAILRREGGAFRAALGLMVAARRSITFHAGRALRRGS
ncbi:MAG: hypothetical protein H7Z38_23990 [Rubrivivax sp.]|nr:hypothetical protein [Pyrinomonadaceae bacterium]